MKKILYVTDLYYHAGGRLYYEEDLFLTSVLRDTFPLVLCNPRDAKHFEDDADLIVWRNTGPVAGYRQEYWAFRERVAAKGLKTYNAFDGKGDMNGKQYLLDLTHEKFPVIPTISEPKAFHTLPVAEAYIVKPKDGADSVGMECLDAATAVQRLRSSGGKMLAQPKIDFDYEVSFYYIDRQFQYALYAPDRAKRWELKPYTITLEDIAFARRFIEWNNLSCGIQRVDACRRKGGELLLVELEDLNPYLSLALLENDTRNGFIAEFLASLLNAMG